MSLAIDDAISKGWRFVYATSDRAVLSYPASSGVGMPGHLVSLVLTLLTCGLWLIPWLIITAIDQLTSMPAQTLHIREVDGIVTQSVIRS